MALDDPYDLDYFGDDTLVDQPSPGSTEGLVPSGSPPTCPEPDGSPPDPAGPSPAASPAPASSGSRTVGPLVRLAAGVELIGRRDQSGYRTTPYLVRRPDGHMVKFSQLLFLVASSLDGQRDLGQVASHVSVAYGREVSPGDIAYLIEQRLQPAGLLHDPDAPDMPVEPADRGRRHAAMPGARHHRRRRPDDLERALRDRVPVVPEHIHVRAIELMAPLFRRPVVIGVLSLLAVADSWLVVARWADLAGGARQVLYQPQLALLLAVLAVGAAVVHESGHATAARYGGAQPGAMEARFRRLRPVFSTEVSRTDRLTHVGRVRCALGGIYFDVLSTLALTLAFALTGFRPLLVLVVLVQLECLVQFLPFVRLDGYYLMSHLAGAPRLYDYLRPALVSLVRHGDWPDRRDTDDKLDELDEPARRLVTIWLAATGVVLLTAAAALLVLLPRLAGAAVGSATAQVDAIVGSGGLAPGRRLGGVVGLVLLAIPIAALAYALSRSADRARRALGAWWQQRPGLTATAIVTAAVIMLLQIGIFWPERFTAAFQRAQGAHEVTRVTAGYGPLDVAAGSLPFPARTSGGTAGISESTDDVVTSPTSSSDAPDADEVAQSDTETATDTGSEDSPWGWDGSTTAADIVGLGNDGNSVAADNGSAGIAPAAGPSDEQTAARVEKGTRWPSADAAPASVLPANGATVQSTAPAAPQPPRPSSGLAADASPAGTTFPTHSSPQVAPAPAPPPTATSSTSSSTSTSSTAPASSTRRPERQQTGAAAAADTGGLGGLLGDLFTTLLVPGG
jgi:putative peptide zinc metalloprotease protein